MSTRAEPSRRKHSGAYYTPDVVVRSLVTWAARRPSDRMLDPACGDGRFLVLHANSTGIEQDADAYALAGQRAPESHLHHGDFFSWARSTPDRFECAAGNPPFIRYQRFTGEVRDRALRLCSEHGARFSALTSSWAPFLVATATLLRPGGRMAFVVPAEIGHAPYAQPVLEYMAGHFGRVQVVAVREKLFPELSEDCWLLYAHGFGASTDHIRLSVVNRFGFVRTPPRAGARVAMVEWRAWGGRLRPFLLPPDARQAYSQARQDTRVTRLGHAAAVGIGYVTGANDFFHLRPSQAREREIPEALLRPSVRSGRSLANGAITPAMVETWYQRDEPILLLDLSSCSVLPRSVRRYLDSPEGCRARATYKCRTRTPWYVVPDVTVPDAFLSYMSGDRPSLVANEAGCVGTNSVHVVELTGSVSITQLQRAWNSPLARLSCEVEGHALGGGMLKLEPREAERVLLPLGPNHSGAEAPVLEEAIITMRQWRHHAE